MMKGLTSLQKTLADVVQDIRHQIIYFYHQNDNSVLSFFNSFIELSWKIVDILRSQPTAVQVFLATIFSAVWLCILIKLVKMALQLIYPSLFRAVIIKYDIMEDKTVLITGANRGKGFQLAKQLALMGARVILACRNVEKAEKALEAIRKSTGSTKLYSVQVDLADMESVRNLAEIILQAEPRLDVLVCNGAILLDRLYRTESGLEVQLATNYLGFFLLSNLLLNLLSTSDGRILLPASYCDLKLAKLEPNNINSELQFKQPVAYCITQLANVFLAKELTRRCHTSKLPVAVNCYDPGRSYKCSGGLLPSTADDQQTSLAVDTMLLLAATSQGKACSGDLFVNSKKTRLPSIAEDTTLSEKLWKFSSFASQLVQKEPPLYS